VVCASALAGLLGGAAHAAPITIGDIVTTRVVGGSGSYTVTDPLTGAGSMNNTLLALAGVAPQRLWLLRNGRRPVHSSKRFKCRIPLRQVAIARVFGRKRQHGRTITRSGDGNYLSVSGYNVTAAANATASGKHHFVVDGRREYL